MSAPENPRALFLTTPERLAEVYGPENIAQIEALVGPVDGPVSPDEIRARPRLLADTELIFSSWGMPRLDSEFLGDAPNLRAVFYAAGTVRGFATDESFARNIAIVSAADANAVPVAEFTFAQIVFSLKRGWLHAKRLRDGGADSRERVSVPGTFRSRVGLLALGSIGQKVCAFLKHTEIDVFAYDPFAPDSVFEACGAKRAALDEIFATCDVVSVHLPNLPSTRKLIDARLLSQLKPGATLINTARGDVLDEIALVETLRARADVWAVLDVLANNDQGVAPEIYSLPNVVLTPHIAGSLDRECHRMGKFIADDLRRYLAGETPLGLVTRERFERMA